MRAPWLIALFFLSACSAIYPTSDFHVAQCGPDLQHWTGLKPCGHVDQTCLQACGGGFACEQVCYDGNPRCGLCVVNEAVLCLREAGCEIEYENLTCCAESESCELSDGPCLEASCSEELADFNSCQGEVAGPCAENVASACFD